MDHLAERAEYYDMLEEMEEGEAETAKNILTDGEERAKVQAYSADSFRDLVKFAKWDKSKHPRGQPDNAGQWANKEGFSGQSRDVLLSHRRFLEGKSVVALKGDEIPHFTRIKELVAWVGKWFRETCRGTVINPVIGEVVVDERGAKRSASHGMSRVKEKAFAAVPAIIKKGRIVHQESMGNMEGYFIAAPIEIAGEKFVGAALVRRDANTQRFYLHEDGEIEKLRDFVINTGAPAEAGELADTKPGAIKTILLDIFSVKKKTKIAKSKNIAAHPLPS